MEQLSVTVEKDTLDKVNELTEKRDVSRSKVVRDLLKSGIEDNNRQGYIENLEEQLRRRSDVEDKVDSLAKYESEPFFVRWYKWYQNR